MNTTVQHRGITASVVAILVVMGAGFLDYYILTAGLPKTEPSANVVVMILTAWNGLAGVVVNYFMGNSANSDRKTELLATSSPPTGTTTTATPTSITSVTEPAAAPAAAP